MTERHAETVEIVLEEIEELTTLPEDMDFLSALDRLREDVADEPMYLTKAVVGTTTGAATALSVGYVAWLARGGMLLSSFLASMPAWRLVDPIPVLAYLKGKREKEDEDGDEESLHSIAEGPAPDQSIPESTADRAYEDRNAEYVE